jgi:hypothetical protein
MCHTVSPENAVGERRKRRSVGRCAKAAFSEMRTVLRLFAKLRKRNISLCGVTTEGAESDDFVKSRVGLFDLGHPPADRNGISGLFLAIPLRRIGCKDMQENTAKDQLTNDDPFALIVESGSLTRPSHQTRGIRLCRNFSLDEDFAMLLA